jgi:creatinase/prolidase-like protein
VRRGLIAWSRDEVPAAALDARVAKLQAAMRGEALDAVLLYTSFPRPAAVAWLTHFVPYWNDALLAVFPGGAPVLLASFSKRVHPWIREVSHVGELRAAPDPGKAAAALLAERRALRVGVVELDALPWRIAQPLAGAGLVDASAAFAAIRQPADAFETALAARATAIARRALAAAAEGTRIASQALAAAEKSARLEGAEDVIARLAPDLREDSTLMRMEGDAPLGARWALELTVSYKGTTVRVAKSFATGARPASWEDAERWFAGASVAAEPGTSPGRIVSWRLEAATGTAPLAAAEPGALPEKSLAVVSASLALADGAWLSSAPVLLGERALA